MWRTHDAHRITKLRFILKSMARPTLASQEHFLVSGERARLGHCQSDPFAIEESGWPLAVPIRDNRDLPVVPCSWPPFAWMSGCLSSLRLSTTNHCLSTSASCVPGKCPSHLSSCSHSSDIVLGTDHVAGETRRISISLPVRARRRPKFASQGSC